jgi:uncharacterized membrane protein
MYVCMYVHDRSYKEMQEASKRRYNKIKSISLSFLFFYVLFDYILVIFRNGWNYKDNSALYTLVTATVFLIVMLWCVLSCFFEEGLL